MSIPFMMEWQIKELLCEIGRRVWMKGFVAANEGNFSCRISDDVVIATPTLMSKGFMKPEDMVVIDMSGRKIGGRRQATSEVRIHLEIYRQRPDIRAVVHVHPPFSTAFAVAKRPLPRCVLPEVELFLGEILIVEYATPGTQEVADLVKPFLKDFTAFLLANHGAITIGKDLEEAYFKMEIVEEYCRLLLYTRLLDGYSQISEQDVSELLEIKKRLGIPDRRLKPGADLSCSIPMPGPAAPEPARSEAIPVERSQIESIVREVLKKQGIL
ncbi:MAG TPA: class II aldolase/adducin family protein [Candidatus Sumerlaeota bacterium]|nr:class II aldolase/adducin family protein [Candidatus Sumerlaeota bacterium]HRU55366.1 class II aldolase/adducin family protein [Candidatus Sumerlaeia bacterium]